MYLLSIIIIVFHHFLLPFWESGENWINPQNFDSLFEIIIGFYLLFTLIPDLISYFALTTIKNNYKVQTFWNGQKKEILDSISDGKQKLHNMTYFGFVSNYLNQIDLEVTRIHEILHIQTKKYLPLNIIVLLLSFSFLFFSANYAQTYVVHKFLISALILILILIFSFAILKSRIKIKPNLKRIDDYFEIIKSLSIAFKEKDYKKMLSLVTP